MPKVIKKIKNKLEAWRKKRLLQNCRRQAFSVNHKTVLFWLHGGMHLLLRLETYFALALQFRGYSPHFIICDGTAIACLVRDEEVGSLDDWPKRCPRCIKNHKDMVEKFSFPYTLLGDLLSKVDLAALRASMPERIEDVPNFTCQGGNLGENLVSALIRYNKHGDLSDLGPRHIQEFAYDAACNLLAAREALQRFKPESIFMSHCIFTDFGPAYKAALENGTHVFAYGGAHKDNSLYFYSLFQENLVPGCSLTDECWEKIKMEPWDDRYDSIATKFYIERYGGGDSRFSDMAGCLPGISGDRQELLDYYNIDGCKPLFILFSQIRWDASADFTGLIFSTYDKFLLASLRAMEANTKVNWLIKLHPAEKNEPRIARTEEFIRKHYLHLPKHIKLVTYDTPFSPKDFFEVMDGGITGCGTSGLEVAAMGKPVITAARYLYANRGFTYDAQTQEHFGELIKRAHALPTLTTEQVQLAKKYLVTYLYRQAIPIDPLSKSAWDLRDWKELPQFLPGNNKNMDLIMDAFMEKSSPLLPFGND